MPACSQSVEHIIVHTSNTAHKSEGIYQSPLGRTIMAARANPSEFESDRADNDSHPATTTHPSYSNQSSGYSRRLMDPARKVWLPKPNEAYQRAVSSPSDPTTSPGWTQIALSATSAPRFRRYMLVYFALFIFAWLGWRMLFSPRLQQQSSLLDSLDSTSTTGTGESFGPNTSPRVEDLIRIRTLDPNLVPADLTGSDAGATSRKRLVIVGDVHGCKEECKSYRLIWGIHQIDKLAIVMDILKKVSFNQKGGDHLIFVGDMINKGPDSTGVVDLARTLSASSVRGNHEDRILHIRHQMVKTGTLRTADGEEYSSLSSREREERKLARSLSDEQAQWLDNCPVILKVGQVPGLGQVVVVHAGLVPGVELKKQDLSSVMTMRTIDPDTHVPSSKKKGMNWAKVRPRLIFSFIICRYTDFFFKLDV